HVYGYVNQRDPGISDRQCCAIENHILSSPASQSRRQPEQPPILAIPHPARPINPPRKFAVAGKPGYAGQHLWI
ncbi:hypothetical protein FRB94_008448, partial [Tulasnella sp. JGI-2019a]